MTNLLQKYNLHFPDIKSLYSYQHDVLHKLELGENTLAIVPTGGGKSLIYQLKALDLPGVTIVISPLLALMQEQVNELVNTRNINAVALNSKMSFEEQRTFLRNIDTSCKLLYLSAERLQNSLFRSALIASEVPISMIVVDEAHCISQWGSGFRPEYAQINGFIDFLRIYQQYPLTLCLTATLSKVAREDIAREFQISSKNIIIKDILRENLDLQFKKVNNEDEKENELRQFLKKYKSQKTIAYLYSQEKCEEYAEAFSSKYVTDYFHAGIDPEEKEEVYSKFLDTHIHILFATTAFGMGINIPDIESVVHLQIPNSIEEYYQQVGRGWRRKKDSRICHCLALWSEVNFDRRESTFESQRFTPQLLNEAFKLITGGRIKDRGQVVNKDKAALLTSSLNLQLVRYKLEKYKIMRTIAEINGSPKSIELHVNTDLWNKITQAAEDMDSFGYVSKALGIPVKDIVGYIFEQDLKGNIKAIPAMKRDVYFEMLETQIPEHVAIDIVNELNDEVDYRIARLGELKDLFISENKEEILHKYLS